MRIRAMRPSLLPMCLLGCLLQASSQPTVSASEFRLEGDYLIGGLFDIHHVGKPVDHDKPEVVNCSSKTFILSSYRRFQLMRFAVEEINNSTNLLPNVSLGYDIYDHCSDTHNFPGIFNLLSVNHSILPWNLSKTQKVIAVVGTYTSTETMTVAPLFMMDLIPMVSYGAASSVFSRKQNFPSFFRTVHPNKDVIQVIIDILIHFNWHWVSFLYVDDDYGRDGQELFINMIKDSKICLAYTKGLNHSKDFTQVFQQIRAQRVNIIILFAAEWTAEDLIKAAIKQNFTNKVWIAGDAWSLNKRLPKEKGIRNVGTVLGVAETYKAIPGFSEFIYSSKSQTHREDGEQQNFCNQVCNCRSQSAKDVIDADPSFSFPVYSAIYAIAHALHSILQCGAGTCNDNITVYPHMIVTELKKSNFTLLNQRIQFDENGDPRFGSYSIVFWNHSGDAQEIGFYSFPPSFNFVIDSNKIQWHSKEGVPTSVCSPECRAGHRKMQDGLHHCCFTCEVCQNGSYINTTEDPYKCIPCAATEWSAEGSTSCNLRLVEYIKFTDGAAILMMVGALALVGITLAMSVLFAINYNTPVVRSAGGPMCFLILGCLSLCSCSVFFYFDKPTPSFCILRFLPFILFYTVCITCFVVRSFQIVCIFKIAAKFPNIYSWWMKYHGQWLFITVAFVTQTLFLVIDFLHQPPKPYNETFGYPDKIILGCGIGLTASSSSVILIIFLCSLCFIFSYMGKDLPKNYNEAKAITFCLLLLIVSWVFFATQYILNNDKYIITLKAVVILFSLYSFLLWYFLPKCYIIIFQPHKNTQQYFQGLIMNYTKTISQ